MMLNQASLDHTMWFYDHEFDTSEWLLYSVRTYMRMLCIFLSCTINVPTTGGFPAFRVRSRNRYGLCMFQILSV